jgi:hypothetical protein
VAKLCPLIAQNQKYFLNKGEIALVNDKAMEPQKAAA